MKMRNIIPLVTGGTLLATLFGGSTLHAATKSKPNLVLVLVDDMGWGAFAPNHVDFTEKELNQEFCRIHVKDYTAEEAFEAAQKATPYLNRYCQEGNYISHVHGKNSINYTRHSESKPLYVKIFLVQEQV